MTARTMTERPLPVKAIFAAGTGMGLAADQLLRASGEPGLNFFLLFAGLAVSVWIVARSGGSPFGREAWSWIGVGVLCAAALMWRGSGLLRFGTFLAACTAFALPALRAGRDWTKRAGILDLIEAMAGAGLHAAFGSARLIDRRNWGEIETATHDRPTRTVLRTAVRGVLLALVPLVVFGALFISADEVFATIVGDFVRIDMQAFASHLVLTTVLSWLACGYLVGVSTGTKLEGVRRLQPARPSLGIAEVATALGLVDLLFLGFVIVQFRYLFGGGAWVEVTPGLTYAAYARSGFFQLVAAVALAIPWLLFTHALLDDRGPGARSVFVQFAGVQLLLLLAIVASAMQRMLVYQAAYGLTELRIVVTATLVWLTVVVTWFGFTVLRGRRDRFAFGGLVTGFVLIGALQVIDPAGRAARHNLDRIGELEVDADYLTTLGSDAAPLLITHLDQLPEEAQCVAASRLLRRWGPERPADWRSFNWSESRARDAVNDDLATLRRLSAREACAEPAAAVSIEDPQAQGGG
jgi:hypothetical protein